MDKTKKRFKIGKPYSDGMRLLMGDDLYENKEEIIKDALRRLFKHYELSCISQAFEVPREKPSTKTLNQ